MRRISVMALVSVVFATAPALAANCAAPEAPDMHIAGSELTVDQHQALTESMIAYDQANADYIACLNNVILQEVEASPAEIETAREQREGLYIKDPETGLWVDPVTARYDALTAEFMEARSDRAAEAAFRETRESEMLLASQLEKVNTDTHQ